MTPTSTTEPFVPTEDIEPQVASLRVTNMNPFVLRDRFDGTVFEFTPNIPRDVPVDAARHIFGWYPPFVDRDGNKHEVDPVAMKVHCQKRFGWNTPAMMENGGADLFYDNLSFRPIMYRMVPVLLDEDDDLNKPSGEKRASKTNKIMVAADEAASRK